MSRSRQVQGEGGPKLAVVGRFLLVPGALGSPCRAWSKEMAPSGLCLQTALGLPRSRSRSVPPVSLLLCHSRPCPVIHVSFMMIELVLRVTGTHASHGADEETAGRSCKECVRFGAPT